MKHRRASRTRDDRGRDVALVDPLGRAVFGPDEEARDPDLEAIIAEVEPQSGRGAARRIRIAVRVGFAALVVMVVGALAILAFGSAAARDNLIGVATNPVFVAPIVAGAIVPWIVAREQRLRRARSAMLRHRRCPGCLQSLQGLGTDADGCTCCPECGAAWRLDRVPALDAPAPGSPHRRSRLAGSLVAGGALLAAALAGVLVLLLIR